jgi:hypothetical protein
MGCDLEYAQELIEEYREAILDEKETVWTKEKPTTTGLYWWRSNNMRTPSIARVGWAYHVKPSYLFVRFEGVLDTVPLDQVPYYIEWQPVRNPKP